MFHCVADLHPKDGMQLATRPVGLCDVYNIIIEFGHYMLIYTTQNAEKYSSLERKSGIIIMG